jgi:hypothetical protein
MERIPFLHLQTRLLMNSTNNFLYVSSLKNYATVAGSMCRDSLGYAWYDRVRVHGGQIMRAERTKNAPNVDRLYIYEY